MSALRDEAVENLAALVGCDTRNPPRAIADSGIVDCLLARLAGFDTEVRDLGDGCLSILAVRGQPDLLFNVHMDTVPVAPGWSVDPFKLQRHAERVVGLGACDIKGAAACLLTVARQTTAPMALLFTTDEEAGTSRCVREFCASTPKFSQVIVAEPTRCAAAISHRGYTAATAKLNGVAGHGSEARAREDNALHHAARLATGLLEMASTHDDDEFSGMSGLRLNIGRIGGGIKANMIAAEAEVCFGIRPLPSHCADQLMAQIRAEIPAERLTDWTTHFQGPPLPAHNPAEQLAAARALAVRCGLPLREHVNFWSEAALFSAAGSTAIVFGPGDIAQAHSADEWVAIDELDRALHLYLGMIH